MEIPDWRPLREDPPPIDMSEMVIVGGPGRQNTHVWAKGVQDLLVRVGYTHWVPDLPQPPKVEEWEKLVDELFDQYPKTFTLDQRGEVKAVVREVLKWARKNPEWTKGFDP